MAVAAALARQSGSLAQVPARVSSRWCRLTSELDVIHVVSLMAAFNIVSVVSCELSCEGCEMRDASCVRCGVLCFVSNFCLMRGRYSARAQCCVSCALLTVAAASSSLV